MSQVLVARRAPVVNRHVSDEDSFRSIVETTASSRGYTFSQDHCTHLQKLSETQMRDSQELSRYSDDMLSDWEHEVIIAIEKAYSPDNKKIANIKKTISHICSCILELTDLEEVQILNERKQMTSVYTHGNNANHTRLFHSFEVMKSAVEIALNLNLTSSSDLEVVALGAFLHDLGHTPFSHCGESGLMELGSIVSDDLEMADCFDHEVNTRRMIFSVKVSEVLRTYKISPYEIVSYLSADPNTRLGKLHGIQEAADGVYSVRDRMSCDGVRAARRTIRAIHKRNNGLRKIKRQNQKFHEIATINSRLEINALQKRAELFSYGNQSPATLLANDIIKQGICDFIRSGLVTPSEFLKLSDEQALKLFDPRYKKLLLHKDKLNAGVEDAIDIIGQWHFNDIDPTAMIAIKSPSFREDYLKMISDIIGDEPVFIPLSDVGPKKIKVIEVDEETGNTREITLISPLNTDHSYVYFAISKDADVDMAVLRLATDAYMKSFLRSGAQQTKNNIFRKVGTQRDRFE